MKLKKIEKAVILALTEDMFLGDITTESVINSDDTARAQIISKSKGVLAGIDIAQTVFKTIDDKIKFKKFQYDGNEIKEGELLAEIEGKAQSILMGERVALNFLQRMSGIASLTRKYCELVKDHKVKIVDTRKTVPGLRFLDKYAVRMGGGKNHRFNLSDGILIKDNHIKIAGGIKKAVERAKKNAPHNIKIEVEVSDLNQVCQAVDAGADIIMLDNMNVKHMREAVKIIAGRAIVEASGGVSLDTIIDIAGTGVDLISVGEITHSVKALDIHIKIL